MWRLKIVFVALVLLVVNLTVERVYACGGGGVIEDEIAGADVIIKARAIESDEAYQNAVVEVESYLKGGPRGSYLLVAQNDPVMTRGIIEIRLFAADCEWMAVPLPIGESVYLFLDRLPSGSYDVTRRSPLRYFHFPTPESVVGEYTAEGRIDFTEEVFVEFIAAQTGETPTEPMMNTPYPSLAPLKITTASGAEYLLPIDGQPPIEFTREVEREIFWHGGWFALTNLDGRCVVGDCLTFSPSGTSMAIQETVDTISVNFISRLIAGQASLFSSTDETLAVWNGAQIDVYMLDYWAQQFEHSGGYELLNTVSLNYAASEAVLVGVGAWSPDGRQLAYGDSEGLWLWDVFSLSSTPRLLIAAAEEELVYPRYFSPMGRYLAFGQGDTLATLDVVAGEQLPDGIVSPNERFLLAYDTAAELTALTECQLAPYECRPSEYMIRQAHWMNDFSYMIIGCSSGELTTCNVEIAGFGNWYGYVRMQLEARHPDLYDSIIFTPTAYAFAYEPVGASIALVTSPSVILINGVEYDLSDHLDSDIVDVEWMRLLFYVE